MNDERVRHTLSLPLSLYNDSDTYIYIYKRYDGY